MPDKEEIIRLWNMGLGRIAVIKECMKINNRRAKDKKDVSKVTMEQAMKYVEPILFEYEKKRLKS